VLEEHLDPNADLAKQAAELLYGEWGAEFNVFDGINNVDELEALIKTYQVFLACLQGRVIGVATISSNDWDVRPDLSPWLGNVCVHTNYRNIGVGKGLVKFALQHVDDVVYLWTYTTDLVRFYENMGFRLLHYVGNHKMYPHIYVLSSK